MNKNYGFLIDPDTQTVCDVCADLWTDSELRQKLRVQDGDLERQQIERTEDTIVVSAFLNGAASGKPSRCEGFELYGNRFFGPALLISSDENRRSPILDPQEIGHVIRFFRLKPNAPDGESQSSNFNSTASRLKTA